MVRFLIIFLAITTTLFAAGNDSYTVLLLHCNGTDASTSFPDDSTSNHSFTAFGNAQVDTAQSKFGGASYLGDGIGDYIKSTDTPTDWDYGTGDFTIDFWIRFNSFPTDVTYTVINQTNGYIDYPEILDVIRWNSPTTYTFPWVPAALTWYHVAITRNGTDLRCFIDGTQIGTTKTDSTNHTNNTQFVVGASTGETNSLEGWMDEIRVSKGIARWTANFTPPTEEYTSEGEGAVVVAAIVNYPFIKDASSIGKQYIDGGFIN